MGALDVPGATFELGVEVEPVGRRREGHHEAGTVGGGRARGCGTWRRSPGATERRDRGDAPPGHRRDRGDRRGLSAPVSRRSGRHRRVVVAIVPSLTAPLRVWHAEPELDEFALVADGAERGAPVVEPRRQRPQAARQWSARRRCFRWRQTRVAGSAGMVSSAATRARIAARDVVREAAWKGGPAAAPGGRWWQGGGGCSTSPRTERMTPGAEGAAAGEVAVSVARGWRGARTATTCLGSPRATAGTRGSSKRRGIGVLVETEERKAPGRDAHRSGSRPMRGGRGPSLPRAQVGVHRASAAKSEGGSRTIRRKREMRTAGASPSG